MILGDLETLFGPLILFGPAYLSVSKDCGGGRGGGAYRFRVWFGLGLQIFLETTCQAMIYHIQKYRAVLFGTWCYWVSIGQYWLVLSGTGSV